MPGKQKITTYLWFDNNAEEAMNFYVSIFKNSKILDVVRYGDAGPGPEGNGHGRHLPTRGAGIHGVERRPTVQVH